ncbi:hypothetical protein D9615_008582 [Tricholomella constricta]|uniref:G-protein coupled receptors family 2 profile 2 domain-containing protein n=1 Tax=Tricholomella constricta TaxID=117010 RepID=A0A8H5M0L0_9AGAR|nr:hypothetical protein D9615_008582 [Tricholomella constricta]
MSLEDAHDEVFAISAQQMEFAGVLAYACTIPGTIVCGLALVAYAVVAYYPKGRKHLDRVSFRLLVQALVSNVLFGIAWGGTPMHPGIGCDFGAFAVNLTLCLATFYTTCIAVNLQLVLVHGVNGKMMEKYYVIVTVVLSLALNVPTYALGEFGWNVLSETCWYSNADNWKRLQWIIGTQSFWVSLAALIETICSIVVLYWLYCFKRSIHSLTRNVTSSVLLGSGRTESTDPGVVWFSNSSTSAVLSRDPRFRKIIVRIALYPIVSLLLNISTVALDLNMSIHEVTSQLDFRLLVLDLFLYGIRTFAYGILAFGDPSFINAVREILAMRRGHSTKRTLTNLNFANSEASTNLGAKFSMDVELQHVATGPDNNTHSNIAVDQMGGDMKTLPSSESGDRRPLEQKTVLYSQEEQEMQSIGRQL